MEQYDLAVIGGGPAGYAAAEQAAAGGVNTILFEAENLGGVCLNEGCIPTKVLLNTSKLLYAAKNGALYGVNAGGAEFAISHGAVLQRKDKVVRALVAGVRSKLKASGAAVVNGKAAVSGRSSGGFIVEAASGGEAGRRIEAARLLIAAGSAPIIPEIAGLREGLEAGFCVTSREALALPEPPGKLVIVGGGVIGLELADYYRAAGSDVTVLELLDRIAAPMDRDITDVLAANLKKKGVQFRLQTRFTQVILPGARAGAAHTAITEAAAGGVYPRSHAAETGGVITEPAGAAQGGGEKPAPEFIPADKILIAIGRKPRSAGMGLAELGVYMERGAVVTDEYMRTNIPNVYAAGDVNGKSMLAHTAYREADCAVSRMAGRPAAMRYGAVPSVIYTNPEAACVGETDESAAAKGLEVKTVKLPLRYSGRYVAENESGDGFCKILFDAGKKRVAGAHIIGSYASEIAISMAFMIESRWPAKALRELTFPHPTVGEALREALFKI